MPNPPKATPHSDIDGVHREERRNTDVAAKLGDSAKDLKQAHDESAARPHYSADPKSKDDRTR